jgi:sodium transport system ATP-binding protein
MTHPGCEDAGVHNGHFPMIEIQQVTVHFPGRRREAPVVALDGIDQCFRAGCVSGLLGSNGAGKTTLMRVLAGLLAPTAGRVLAYGADAGDPESPVRRRVGFVSPESVLFDRLTPRETLAYLGTLRGMAKPALTARIDALAGLLGIGALLDREAENFSTGQHRKVALAAALLHGPEILLFDEPTSGLDIPTTREVRRLMVDQALRGKVVVLASHSAEEVAMLCAEVTVLHRGRVRACGTPESLTRSYSPDGCDFEAAMSKLCADEEVVPVCA